MSGRRRPPLGVIDSPQQGVQGLQICIGELPESSGGSAMKAAGFLSDRLSCWCQFKDFASSIGGVDLSGDVSVSFELVDDVGRVGLVAVQSRDELAHGEGSLQRQVTNGPERSAAYARGADQVLQRVAALGVERLEVAQHLAQEIPGVRDCCRRVRRTRHGSSVGLDLRSMHAFFASRTCNQTCIPCRFVPAIRFGVLTGATTGSRMRGEVPIPGHSMGTLGVYF